MPRLRVALVCAILLLSAVGLHSYSHGDRVVLHRSLSSFPMTVGDWQGQEVKLDEKSMGILKADELLLRLYSNPSQTPMWLYIAYYGSQRQGETIHSPKNCLPGSGWEPVQSGRIAIQDGSGHTVFINRYVVEKGLDRQLVLYWYQMHGRVVASEYWGKFYLVLDALKRNRTDGAVVRVSLPIDGDQAQTEQVARDFLRQVTPMLNQYIPE